MGNWKPYVYQEDVSNRLLAGKSLVLQAPTGAGKTTAALLPFIHGWRADTGCEFSTKCIYVVPMRVLANQFVYEWEERIASMGRRFRQNLEVRIQTGDRPEDRRFEGDLIFCTIDQALSSFLTMPYSLPRRQANLNAGALAGAYLVFDEFHLLDPASTLSTTLYAIKQLRQLAPVLLMTATFSQSMLETLAKEIGAEPYLVSADEAHTIATRDGKEANRRIWRTEEELLSAQAVLDKHRSRSLVLCNTVQRAQKVYRELRKLGRERGIETMLLHGRFLPEDRRSLEERLRDEFGKASERKGSLIAVATQTIEVGVDISCENLHTELAPASALIQRAGRCARYPGEEGTVIVYPVERYSPYGRENKDKPENENAWVQEMKAALEWLRGHNGRALDFAGEQELVDAVATPRDRRILEGLAADAPDRAHRIHAVLLGEQGGQASRYLVRDADSRTALIHPNPDELLVNPYGAKGFSLPVNTLRGMTREWLERELAEEPDWRVQTLLEDLDAEAEENRTRYAWKPLYDAKLVGAVQVVVVHPALAGYLPDEGFVSDVGETGFNSTTDSLTQAATGDGYSYRVETYEQHIRHVLAAFEQIALPELRYPAAALERAAGWREDSLIEMAWLVCLLHDVGKLSEGWQAWAHFYQKAIGKPAPSSTALAHTDREWDNEVHRAGEKQTRKKHPKPRHAAEGAIAVSGILASALGQNEMAVRAGLTAVARHHAPFVADCTAFALSSDARQHVEATLKYVPQAVQDTIRLDRLRDYPRLVPTGFANTLIHPSQELGWVAYTLLARALRWADQAGTARGTRGDLEE
jgi:CRISPR-associated endonuclease/helicase Cas3